MKIVVFGLVYSILGFLVLDVANLIGLNSLLVVLGVILTEKFLLNHKNMDGNSNQD